MRSYQFAGKIKQFADRETEHGGLLVRRKHKNFVHMNQKGAAYKLDLNFVYVWLQRNRLVVVDRELVFVEVSRELMAAEGEICRRVLHGVGHWNV